MGRRNRNVEAAHVLYIQYIHVYFKFFFRLNIFVYTDMQGFGSGGCIPRSFYLSGLCLRLTPTGTFGGSRPFLISRVRLAAVRSAPASILLVPSGSRPF